MTQKDGRRDGAAWIVMAVAIVLAVLSWAIALEQDRRQAALRFRVAVDGSVEAIATRMQQYELALRASSGLFDTVPGVSADDWAIFVGAMRLAEALPGLQGIGYARFVGPSPAEAAQGAAGDGSGAGTAPAAFSGELPGSRAVVELIEPLDAGNRRAVGLDLYVEGMRREAMDRARDDGQPALSGPVQLIQETGEDRQTGFLMFLAIYQSRSRPTTVAARRAALRGFVYCPFRGRDLLDGILPRHTPGFGFSVYDGTERRADALIHASEVTGPAVHDAVEMLQLPGRQWTLHFTGTSAFDDAARSKQPLLVALVGGLMNLSLLAYLRSAARERRRALGETHRLAAAVERRRGAEHALRESERGFREVVEASPTGLLLADANGRIVLANPQAERLFGYEPNELLGRPVEGLLPDVTQGWPTESRGAPLRDPQRRPMGEGRDLRGRRRDGSTFPLEIALSPMDRRDGPMVLATVVDLSARQAVQDQLAAALREKTVLLDEVHHRVKNNLQVITSLLSLQARGAPPEARAALADCRNRVHAMALTHQLLHENSDVTRLHVGEYLQRLARLLADSHRQSAGAVVLRVTGADTPLFLELPRAIPCGLLVNELVTNAYKHAFPAGRQGTITIALALEGDIARLTVTDDGIGLPADFDPGAASSSLGFQLVPLLVDQLRAELHRLDASGTSFAVTFAANPQADR
jgi:PAS domain S-box-containing protein